MAAAINAYYDIKSPSRALKGWFTAINLQHAKKDP